MSLVIIFFNPGWGRAFYGTGAWQGIYLDKNLFGAAASLAIISQAALFSYVKGRQRTFVAAGIAFAFLLLLGSNSATAFGDCAVVILAMLVVVACCSPRFGAFARFATVLAAAIACGAVVIFGLTLDSVFDVLGRSATLTGRTDFWPYVLRAIADQPILGYGYDAFFYTPVGDSYMSEYVVQAGGWSPYHAHNSYLQVLLDAGYVGLAALVVLVVTSLGRAIAYFARERHFISAWPLAIILFLTTGSYAETYYLNYNNLEWILFVAAIVYPLQYFTAVTPVPKERN